jgi:hypothetical protein
MLMLNYEAWLSDPTHILLMFFINVGQLITPMVIVTKKVGGLNYLIIAKTSLQR